MIQRVYGVGSDSSPVDFLLLLNPPRKRREGREGGRWGGKKRELGGVGGWEEASFFRLLSSPRYLSPSSRNVNLTAISDR